nr:type VI secretion system-associated FHA domain protein [Xanthobacter agilis]
MRARLTVTSEQGRGLGASATHDFDAAGGVIGRSATCDWRLPDPTHTLSARHAEIRFNGQGFTVVDLSTNGVYLNTTDAPLGRGNAAVLVDGDLLYLGSYVISAEIRRIQPAAAPERPMADPLPPLRERAPAALPLAAPFTTPGTARGPLSPAAYPGATQGIRDPLAALDGQSVLQESDNPFSDLGIGQMDGEGTDTARRAGARPGGIDDLLTPRPVRPTFDFTPGPAAPPPAAPPPAAPAPMAPFPAALAIPTALPPRAPIQAPPPDAVGWPAVPPARPVVTAPPQPTDAEEAAAVIPPGFLDELSILIPRLVSAGDAAAPAAVAPAPPRPPAPPFPVAPAPLVPPADLDDPEEMVTLLRMRGKGKAQPPAARAPQPFLAPPMPALRPLAADTPPLPPPRPAAPEPASENDLWALLGVEPARLTAPERERLLGEVAALLRTLVQGLLALKDTQRRLKDDLRLDADRRAVSDNPFEAAASPEEALSRALARDSARDPRTSPAGAAQAVLNEMNRHEMAAIDALQATAADLLERVSPAAIAFDLEDEGPSNGIFARKADKMKLWDRYLMMHERLVGALDVVSSEVMGRAFARSYAQRTEDSGRQDLGRQDTRREEF